LPCRFEPEAERNRLQYIAKHQEREATGKDAELEEGSRQWSKGSTTNGVWAKDLREIGARDCRKEVVRENIVGRSG
jgi:hypothetical protein